MNAQRTSLARSTDPFWSQLGYSDERCPDCGVRLYITERETLLCLNACELAPETRARFAQTMTRLAEAGRTSGPPSGQEGRS